MIINGVEIELDLMDADTLEKFEEGCLKVKEKVVNKKNYEGKSNADCIRYQCGVINEFFDSLCGAGTSEKLFRGKSNIGKSMEAFAAVVAEANNGKEHITAISEKYLSGSVSPNRAARRNKKHRKANVQTLEFRDRP